MNDTDKKLIYEFCGGKKIERFVAKLDGWRFGDIVYTIISDPDLNFYFKYAVPKVYKEYGESGLSLLLDRWTEVVLFTFTSLYDPDEAFGQALLKLIKDKK